MHKEDFKIRETMCIVINQDNKMEYSNTDNKTTWDYELIKQVTIRFISWREFRWYCVTMDKF